MKDFPIQLLKQNSRERLIIETRVFKLLDKLKAKYKSCKITSYILIYGIAILSSIITCLNIYSAQSNTTKHIKIISLTSALIAPIIILFNQMLNNLSLKKKVILYKTNINKIEHSLWGYIETDGSISFEDLLMKVNKIRSVINESELQIYNHSMTRNITPPPVFNKPIISPI